MRKQPGGKTPHQNITERAFDFAVRIVKLCEVLDEKRGVSRVLMSQILRAGTSVVSNVEEAQAAQSRADFVSKMSIALKEARETFIRLRILAVAGVMSEQELGAIIREAEEVKLVIGAIIVSTKRRGL